VGIDVRPAVESDLPALLDLYRELHPADPVLPDDVARQTWKQIQAQQGRTILVAEVDGVVAGTVDCTVLPNLTRGARPFVQLENVVVAQSHRRRGIGARLLEATAELAKAAGCYKVQLHTALVRSAAHAFYEAAGYEANAQGYRCYFIRPEDR
jgi:GNAT superfamily N-acetyltransferase